MRKIAVSYWTAGILGVVIVAVHAKWSGFGAALIVLGVYVAARPYIRAGVEGLAMQQVQAPQFTPLLDSEGKIIREAQASYRRKIQAAIPDVIAERVIAVAIVLLGTVLNGYGTPIARAFGWNV